MIHLKEMQHRKTSLSNNPAAKKAANEQKDRHFT
jgi:hypothetical protein